VHRPPVALYIKGTRAKQGRENRPPIWGHVRKVPPKEMRSNRLQKPAPPPDPHNHSAFLTMGVKME